MSNETARVLFDAAALVRRPGAWTQGTSARTSSGDWIDPRNPSARSFCAIGAVERESGIWGDDALQPLAQEVGIIHLWNDARGQTAENVAATMERVAIRELGAFGPRAYRVACALTRLYTERGQ